MEPYQIMILSHCDLLNDIVSHTLILVKILQLIIHSFQCYLELDIDTESLNVTIEIVRLWRNNRNR
jgi:hypothetical protein